MPGRAASRSRPAAVGTFEQALTDWLASFTSPAPLAAEMADACAYGTPWVAAIAGVSARRAGWADADAMAWGLCVGGLAGALEAAARSLAAEGALAAAAGVVDGATETASGPALPLLAADGLIAAAHETLGSLDPGHARAALAALAHAFGDGGPWRTLSAEWPAPAWAAVVSCALGPAAEADPGGPWADWAEAWQAAYGGGASGDAASARTIQADDPALWDHAAADPDTRSLMRSAAHAAAGGAPTSR